MLLGLLLAGPALAGQTTVALSGGGGFDYLSAQPWAGIDLAFLPEMTRGWSPVGRLRGAWGFGDQRPFGVLEAGFAGVLPARSMAPRLGLVAHLQAHVADHSLPLQIGGPPEADTFGKTGLLPGGMLLAELGWQRQRDRGAAAWSLGLNAGAGLGVARVACPEGADVDQVCLGSRVAFLGGITGRIRFHEGVYLEALVGPTASLTLGYAWGVGGITSGPP